MQTNTHTSTKIVIGLIIIALIGTGLWYVRILRFRAGTWMPYIAIGRQAGDLPRLERPAQFPAEFPPEARTIVENKIAADRAKLAENPRDADALLDLAIQYKIAGDIRGAIEIWVYMTEVFKGESVPYHNLGSVYHLELKEYEKSESYYKQAIDVNPTMSINYIGLHELYRYSYKTDTTLAVDILQEGIGKIDTRGKLDLYTTLGGYYVEKGDKPAAISAYTEARKLARGLGNTGILSNIEAELSRLK